MDTKAYRYRQEAMKRWILLFIVSLFSLFSLFVLGIYAIAAERYYDESGRYMGRMDDSGRMYDKSGRYQGRVSEDGRFYDNSGRYQGRQSSDGRYYDKSGRYQGRMTEAGRGKANIREEFLKTAGFMTRAADTKAAFKITTKNSAKNEVLRGLIFYLQIP